MGGGGTRWLHQMVVRNRRGLRHLEPRRVRLDGSRLRFFSQVRARLPPREATSHLSAFFSPSPHLSFLTRVIPLPRPHPHSSRPPELC